MSPRSRMRLAMRSGWNGSKSSRPSPVDAKMMGRPVTDATESAAPPRASPSSLDSTTPVKSTPSWKAFAVVTASWPIIASMTNSTSSGFVALRMFAACFIISASTPRRPAVSMMTTSCCWRARRASTPSFATCTGSPTPLPGSGAKTGTPACPPTTCSWFTAFGRWRSAATSIGVWPSFSSHFASLPASVVLPAPWRPASMMTVGGFFANCRRRCSPPRIATSSSLTICTTCCAGFSALLTSSPSARSRTVRGELLDDVERDVGVEQGATDLADGAVDVGRRELALGAEVLEGLGEAVRQGSEGSHGAFDSKRERMPAQLHVPAVTPRSARRRPRGPMSIAAMSRSSVSSGASAYSNSANGSPSPSASGRRSTRSERQRAQRVDLPVARIAADGRVDLARPARARGRAGRRGTASRACRPSRAGPRTPTRSSSSTSSSSPTSTAAASSDARRHHRRPRRRARPRRRWSPYSMHLRPVVADEPEVVVFDRHGRPPLVSRRASARRRAA